MTEGDSLIRRRWIVWGGMLAVLVVLSGLIPGELRSSLTQGVTQLLGVSVINGMQQVAPLTAWGHALVHLVVALFSLFVLNSYRALAILIAAGIAVEFFQYFVPGRVPSITDIWVNLSATLLAVVLYLATRGVVHLMNRR